MNINISTSFNEIIEYFDLFQWSNEKEKEKQQVQRDIIIILNVCYAASCFENLIKSKILFDGNKNINITIYEASCSSQTTICGKHTKHSKRKNTRYDLSFTEWFFTNHKGIEYPSTQPWVYKNGRVLRLLTNIDTNDKQRRRRRNRNFEKKFEKLKRSNDNCHCFNCRRNTKKKWVKRYCWTGTKLKQNGPFRRM